MASAQGRAVMRLSDLQDKTVRTLDGETLGRVHEVHCDKGRIVALMCGPGSLVERLTAKQKGRRIAWEDVRRVTPKVVVIVGPPPPSAARARPGTRRPSGRRSKR